MAHLARYARHIVIVIAEADVDRHAEGIGNGLGVVESGLVVEVEVVIGRRIVVEIIAEQEDLLDGGRD